MKPKHNILSKEHPQITVLSASKSGTDTGLCQGALSSQDTAMWVSRTSSICGDTFGRGPGYRDSDLGRLGSASSVGRPAEQSGTGGLLGKSALGVFGERAALHLPPR